MIKMYTLFCVHDVTWKPTKKMLLFCPTCSNVLTVEEGTGPSRYRFACQTCPYVYNITKKVSVFVVLFEDRVCSKLHWTRYNTGWIKSGMINVKPPHYRTQKSDYWCIRAIVISNLDKTPKGTFIVPAIVLRK